jgi:hypothetical protein
VPPQSCVYLFGQVRRPDRESMTGRRNSKNSKGTGRNFRNGLSNKVTTKRLFYRNSLFTSYLQIPITALLRRWFWVRVPANPNLASLLKFLGRRRMARFHLQLKHSRTTSRWARSLLFVALFLGSFVSVFRSEVFPFPVLRCLRQVVPIQCVVSNELVS